MFCQYSELRVLWEHCSCTNSYTDFTQKVKFIDKPKHISALSSQQVREEDSVSYELDEQIGYLLRLANQRHLEIFSEHMPSLTPTQFSVLARLYEVGQLSQNKLGRQVGMDAATTNGVVDRLTRKGLVKSKSDTTDKRRLCISLTEKGIRTTERAIPVAQNITRQTVRQLSTTEWSRLVNLLKKLQNS